MRKSRIMLFVLLAALAGVSGYKAWMQKRANDYRAAQMAQAAQSQTLTAAGAVLTGAELAGCIKSGQPTLVEFGRDTCKACQMMAPRLEQAAKDYAGKAHIVSVNLDKFGEFSKTYKVSGIPTQVLFDATGKEVFRNQGCMEQSDIDKQLQQAGAK